MLENQAKISNIIPFVGAAEKLFKKYIEEYDDLYQKIFLLTPYDFMQNIIKRVEISMKGKFNDFPQTTKSQIEEFITEKIYSLDYKFAQMVKRNILHRSTEELQLHIFNYDIIPHCEKCKKDGYYIHTCGEKFQSYRYKPLNNDVNNDPTKKDFLLYCIKCDMIYKSTLIKFKCFFTNEDFYSKLIDNTFLSNNTLPLATWKKYHCNLIINDAMKCQICNDSLYYIETTNQLFCKKCNLNFDPTVTLWKCINCKNDFISEVKIFNPLECKSLKICVKDTICNKIKAKPYSLGCGCKLNIKNLKFFHKNSCVGQLFLGKLNGKKVVVCSKCEALGNYDNYLWTCPHCLKRFKLKINENNNKENKNILNIVINNENLFKSPDKNDIIINNEPLGCFSDIKEIKNFIPNNSPDKIYYHQKFITGIQSPIKTEASINNIQILNKNQDSSKIINLTPLYQKQKIINYSPINRKCESKIVMNKIPISRNFSNFKRNNNIITNMNLCDTKNLEKEFFANNEIIKNTQLHRNNSSQAIPLDSEKNSPLIKYKKNIVGSYSKIINRPLSINNSIRNVSVHNNNEDFCCPPIRRVCTKVNGSFNINNSSYISLNSNNNENKIINNNKVIPGMLNIDNYNIIKQIGQGSFGQIFLVEDKIYKKKYALKKITATSSDDVTDIEKEYRILLNIQNSDQEVSNVVNLYGVNSYKLDFNTTVVYVLMELANTDWEKEIKEKKKTRNYYEESELMQILSTLIRSMAILQQKNISHRDIKPQNILIFNDEIYGKIYKLADFGEAKILIKGDRPTNKQTLRGTKLYMSPILFQALKSRRPMRHIQHNPYKSDVFSFGLCGLFAATLCIESLYDIRDLQSNVSIFVVIENYLKYRYSYDLINIIAKMLDINEDTRMDFVQLEIEFTKLGY